MNLRPFQDKAWLDAGGGKHVCVSIGFFFFALPTMPLGAASSLRPGADVPNLRNTPFPKVILAPLQVDTDTS